MQIKRISIWKNYFKEDPTKQYTVSIKVEVSYEEKEKICETLTEALTQVLNNA